MNRLSKYLNIALLATLSLVAGGCDDNSNDGPIDLFEVIVNKPMVRIGQNEVATVNIILGNEGRVTIRRSLRLRSRMTKSG